MSNLEIARCTVTIEAMPPVRQYGWVIRGVTVQFSLPFRSSAERARFLRLLAAHVGSAVSNGTIEELAALLCLYRCGDETAAWCAVRVLDREYASLLTITPLEEVDEMVGPLLEEAAAAEEAR